MKLVLAAIATSLACGVIRPAGAHGGRILWLAQSGGGFAGEFLYGGSADWKAGAEICDEAGLIKSF